MSTAPLDRRALRRQQTIDEVLDIAVEIMTEQGVGGLSLGELARRMGIRPPSLYVYFPSKHAIYDALFARGAQDLLDTVEEATDGFATSDDLADTLLTAGTAMVRWCVAHPAYSQLLFWRPVPGFVPSQEAYGPAVELVASSQRAFTDFKTRPAAPRRPGRSDPARLDHRDRRHHQSAIVQRPGRVLRGRPIHLGPARSRHHVLPHVRQQLSTCNDSDISVKATSK